MGSEPRGVAVDPDTGYVFVSNYASNTITVLDEFNGTRVHTTHVGTGPIGIGVDPDLGLVYVANSVSNTVSVINETNFKVWRTIGVSSGPTNLVVSPDLSMVFVAAQGAAVSTIDENSFVAQTVPLPAGAVPQALAFDPGSGMLYVAGWTSSMGFFTGQVWVVNSSTWAVDSTVTVSGLPKGIDVNPFSGVVYVGSAINQSPSPSGPSITELNESSLATIGSEPAGSEPSAVVVDSSLNVVYVADGASSDVMWLQAVIPPQVTASPGAVDTGYPSNLLVTSKPAGGSAPYKCQWFSSTDGHTFTVFAPSDCSSSVPASGALGSTYYSLQANDSESPPETVYSPLTEVTVNTPLTAVITPPSPATDVGLPVSLFVAFQGGTPPYTVQWSSGLGCASPIPGADAARWITPDLTADTSFSAMLADSGGTPAPTYCVGTTVTVSPALAPPVISLSPSTVVAANTSSLSVASPFTGGTSPFVCQWEESNDGSNYFNLGSSFTCGAIVPQETVSGTSTGTLYFKLQVADSVGGLTTSAPATLTVVDEVVISCTPNPVTVGKMAGCTGTFLGFRTRGTLTWSSTGSGRFSALTCRLVKSKCSVKYTPLAGISPVNIEGAYAGDPNDSPAMGQAPLSVSPVTSRVTVTCAPVSVVAGSARTVTCRARVTGYSPTGTILWNQTGTGLVSFGAPSCLLSRSTCTVTMTGINAGPVTVQGNYTGDPSNTPGSKTAKVTVKPAKPTLSVSCLATAFSSGTNDTCTATLSGFTGSVSGEVITWTQTGGAGKVRFYSSACALSAGGSCSVVMMGVKTGLATVKAAYGPDQDNLGCFKLATLKVTK